MSPTTLGLSILGLTTVSTGIGIAVVNLTNTNNKSIDEEIKGLWEKIVRDFQTLIHAINKIMSDNYISKKYIEVASKIRNIAEETKDNKLVLKIYEKTSKIPTLSNLERLKEIDKQIQEVSDLLKELNREKIEI